MYTQPIPLNEHFHSKQIDQFAGTKTFYQSRIKYIK